MSLRQQALRAAIEGHRAAIRADIERATSLVQPGTFAYLAMALLRARYEELCRLQAELSETQS